MPLHLSRGEHCSLGAQSRLTVRDPMDCSPAGSSVILRQNTEAGWHFLLQGIFPAQGPSPHLSHWQVASSLLSNHGSPVSYPSLLMNSHLTVVSVGCVAAALASTHWMGSPAHAWQLKVSPVRVCSVAADPATPWTAARRAPPSMGFSRQDGWSGLPIPPLGNLPDLGSSTHKVRWDLGQALGAD